RGIEPASPAAAEQQRAAPLGGIQNFAADADRICPSARPSRCCQRPASKETAENKLMTKKKDSRRASGRRLGGPGAGGAAAAAVLGLGLGVTADADHEGLPFTETFDDAHLSDPDRTRADWGGSTAGRLGLPMAPSL